MTELLTEDTIADLGLASGAASVFENVRIMEAACRLDDLWRN
jgi:hypothetical protein